MWKRMALAALLMLSACSQADDGSSGDDWPDYDGPGAAHASPLDEINTGNAGKLGLAWHFDLDIGGASLTAPVAVSQRLVGVWRWPREVPSPRA